MDFSTMLLAPELMEQQNQSPPYMPALSLLEGGQDVPQVNIINSTNVGNKLAIGLTPTFLDHVKDKLGAAQTAVATPVQSFARSTAKAVGATDETAQDVSSWFLPVVLVVAGIVAVVMMVKGGVFGRKAIKL